MKLSIQYKYDPEMQLRYNGHIKDVFKSQMSQKFGHEISKQLQVLEREPLSKNYPEKTFESSCYFIHESQWDHIKGMLKILYEFGGYEVQANIKAIINEVENK